jgi:hypothetical protein
MFDPFTCDWHRVWRYQRDIADQRGDGAWDVDCDCGASPVEYHSERCSITPIYAALTGELGSVTDVTNKLYWEFMNFRDLLVHEFYRNLAKP